MIIAKTDKNLSAEEYQKWHDLYTSMVSSGVLMVDGKFTVYNIDKNGNLERIDDKRGNTEGH
jgi:hypothetical protein